MGNLNSSDRIEYDTFDKNIYDYNSYNWIPNYPSYRDTYVDDETIDSSQFKDICDMRMKIPNIPEDDKQGLHVIKIINTYINMLLYRSKILSKFHPSLYFTHYNIKEQFGVKQLHSFRMVFNSLKNFGFCSENDCPTNNKTLTDNKYPGDSIYIASKKYRNMNIYSVKNNIDMLKYLLNKDMMVLVGFPIYTNFYNSRSSSVLSLPSDDDKEIGGICGIILGYVEEDKRFIMLISKGKYWGDNGFIYVNYDYISDRMGAECRIMVLNEELIKLNDNDKTISSKRLISGDNYSGSRSRNSGGEGDRPFYV